MNGYTIPTLIIKKAIKCTIVIMLDCEVMINTENIKLLKNYLIILYLNVKLQLMTVGLIAYYSLY